MILAQVLKVSLDHLKWVTLNNLIYAVVTWLSTVAWRMLWWPVRLAWRWPWMTAIGTTATVSIVGYLVFRWVSHELDFNFYEHTAFESALKGSDVFSPRVGNGIFAIEGHDTVEAAVRTLQFACVTIRGDQRARQSDLVASVLPGTFNDLITETLHVIAFGDSMLSTEMNSDQVVRTLVVLTKLPATDEKSWPPLVSMTFLLLEKRAKQLRLLRQMSLLQDLEYRYLVMKFKQTTDHIDMASFDSEAAFVQKCFKKTVKALVPRHCNVCGGPAERRCGKCKLVRYCSLECQNLHWNTTHKHTCVKFSHQFPPVDDPPPMDDDDVS